MTFYKPFSIALNVATQQMVTNLFPTGYDISKDAPETLEDLCQHIRDTGRMLVSSENCEGTIFGSAEINMDFRAWHDWCHWYLQAPFTREGEALACAEQQRHLKVKGLGDDRAKALLDIEVNEQAFHYERHGAFPTNQRAFTRVAMIARGLNMKGIPTQYEDAMAGHKTVDSMIG